MPVFISHRTADDAIARAVYDRLTRVHQIPCYIDDLDRQASTRNVTALIVGRLKQCTNLLALMTSNTRGSWWVPFEVGVAREAPRVITTFTNLAQDQLPEFLTEWPVLRGDRAIDTFAEHYKKSAVHVKRAFVDRTGPVSDGISGIEDFHRNLKIAIGQ